MAGHSKFANIKHRKAAVDAKRGKAFSKHAKAIATAAKLGGGDVFGNPRLALAIEKARADNMPKDNIERAIKKGTGELDGANYDEVRYEAYGPGGVAFLIDSLTDNRNRTAPELRSLLEKYGGRLAETGAVAWGFEARAVVAVEAAGVDEDALTEAIMELGADDLQREDDAFEVLGVPTTCSTLAKGLKERGYKVVRAEIAMLPQNTVQLELEDARRVLNLLEALEDHEDVQNTYSNLEIPDALLEALNAE